MALVSQLQRVPRICRERKRL